MQLDQMNSMVTQFESIETKSSLIFISCGLPLGCIRNTPIDLRRQAGPLSPNETKRNLGRRFQCSIIFDCWITNAELPQSKEISS